MSSVNQEYTRRVKEEKIARRLAKEKLQKQSVVVAPEEPILVRARTEEGKFIKDDPTTEKNEAWVEKPKKEKVLVRARTKKGKFIKDDPNTEKNEAWVEKPKKKKSVSKKS